MHPTAQFLLLLNKYTSGTLTPEEEQQFVALLQSGEYRDWLTLDVQEKLEQEYKHAKGMSLSAERSRQMVQNIFDSEPQPIIAPAHRVHFLKTAWFKYAAVFLVTLSAATYIWMSNQQSKDIVAATLNNSSSADISPGGQKAVLTLGDGKEIILDNAATGNLAEQGSAQIVKLSSGQIAYQSKSSSDEAVVWNTMSTPAGGQFQVILPDQTKVWLNAQSSIKYPTAFTGKNREVKISGEVYFEVAKNKKKPFVVDVDGKSKVQVLGTHFNINSYGDEGTIKTTLLEGSVKIIDKSQSVILTPGQQAQVPTNSIGNISKAQPITISEHADLEQTMAWKNGLFNFSGADVPAVMHQLERWYAIKVTYEGATPLTTFSGKIYRNVPLSVVLESLQRMGVRYRIQDKNLMILKKGN